VLPAQMSRVIRSLENRERPLIQCRINSRDKRKIDVDLTANGEKTLVEYQGKRVGRIVEQLSDLTDDDQDDMIRTLNKLHGLLDARQ
jgi:DNA-binding MarR family transcriptional regulator